MKVCAMWRLGESNRIVGVLVKSACKVLSIMIYETRASEKLYSRTILRSFQNLRNIHNGDSCLENVMSFLFDAWILRAVRFRVY